MKELSNIAILLILAIIYLVSYAKVISKYLNSFFGVTNNATTTLFISSLAASGILLLSVSKVISDSYFYFYSNNSIGKAIGYSIGFCFGTWVFAVLFFFLSFQITSLLTKENEKESIRKNNVELALVHASMLVILSLTISSALVSWAISFIPYPKLPF